jgi:hypothetical protein
LEDLVSRARTRQVVGEIGARRSTTMAGEGNQYFEEARVITQHERSGGGGGRPVYSTSIKSDFNLIESASNNNHNIMMSR